MLTINRQLIFRLIPIIYGIMIALLTWWLITTTFRHTQVTEVSRILQGILTVQLLVAFLVIPFRLKLAVFVVFGIIGMVVFTRQARGIFLESRLIILMVLIVFNMTIMAIEALYTRNPRIFISRTLLIAVGVLFAIGVTEMAVRLTNEGSAQESHELEREVYGTLILDLGDVVHWAEPTGTLGARSRSTQCYWVIERECVHEIFYNDYGYHGPKISYAKDDDTFRIMMLGDSFIEAIQVEYPQTIQVQLASLLENAEPFENQNLEVFGIGISGWGTINEYLYFEHEGYQYESDLVILTFVWNDLRDNVSDILPSAAEASSSDDEQIVYQITEHNIDVEVISTDSLGRKIQVMTERVLEGTPGFVKDNSELWRVLYDNVVGDGELVAVLSDPTNLTAEMTDAAWARTRLALQLLQERVTQGGGQLILVSVPRPESVGEGAIGQQAMDQGLQDISSELDIQLLRLSEVYQTQIASDEVGLYGDPDEHWTASGHQITAQILFQWLQEIGVFETG